MAMFLSPTLADVDEALGENATNGTNVTFHGCLPSWAESGESCPYGSGVHIPFGSFTAPPSPGLSVLIAEFYSVLPFFAVLVNVFLICKRRRPREVLWLLFSVANVTFNQSMQLFSGQHRPASCLTSCGMPSGHSCYAIGLLLFVLLWDSVARVPTGDEPTEDERRTCRGALLTCFLLPVPWARVHLGDHSERQVFVGSAIGAVGAAVWLVILGPCCEAFLDKVFRSSAISTRGNPRHTSIQSSGSTMREAVLDRSLLDRSSHLELSKGRHDDTAAVLAATGSMHGSTGAAPVWDDMGDAI
mmetsp:Transcript_53080/g.116219  ORF Transcript_53080/g.116219 Transcript_53080/m.116219 type:complete len:301 (+) Transcript_53080:364-1266(+)